MKSHSRVLSSALTLFLIASLATGCATVSVTSDHDPDVDFSAYSTFGWGSESSGVLQSFLDAALQGAVNRNLVAKGFVRDSERPDLQLVSHVSIEEDMSGSVVNHWTFHGWSWYSGWGATDSAMIKDTVYPPGTLVLDVIDGSTGKLVWRGIAEGVVTDAQANREELEPIVDKLLAGFPPL